MSPKWKLAPTRREQEKWDRATKAATGGSVSLSLQLMDHLCFDLLILYQLKCHFHCKH